MQYNNFGKFIRHKRLSYFPLISLNEFAFTNEIEPAILSRIERNLQGVKLETIEKLAKGFNMRASELLKEYEESEFFE